MEENRNKVIRTLDVYEESPYVCFQRQTQGTGQMTKATQNAYQLVTAAVAVMQNSGMPEAAIIAELPRLAKEAVKFLAAKAA
jgi:hypothetical protein